MKVLLNIVCRIFVVLELPREEKNLILDYLQSVIFCFVTTQRAITRYWHLPQATDHTPNPGVGSAF